MPTVVPNYGGSSPMMSPQSAYSPQQGGAMGAPQQAIPHGHAHQQQPAANPMAGVGVAQHLKPTIPGGTLIKPTVANPELAVGGFDKFRGVNAHMPTYADPYMKQFGPPTPEAVMRRSPALAFILNGNPGDTRLGYNPHSIEKNMIAYLNSPASDAYQGPTLVAQLRSLYTAILSQTGSQQIAINGRQSALYSTGSPVSLLDGYINKTNNPDSTNYINLVLLPFTNALQKVIISAADNTSKNQMSQKLTGTLQEMKSLQSLVDNTKSLVDSQALGETAKGILDGVASSATQALAGSGGQGGGGQGGGQR